MQIRLPRSGLGGGRGTCEDGFEFSHHVGKSLFLLNVQVVKPIHCEPFLRLAHLGGIRIELRGFFKRLPGRTVIARLLLLGFRRQEGRETVSRFRAMVEIFRDTQDVCAERKNRREVSDPLEHLREIAVFFGHLRTRA